MARKTKKNTVDKNATAPVLLAERPCIKHIGELRESLVAAQAAGSPVVIDASQVEAVDTAILQLLVAFANTCREHAIAIEWTQLSDAFRGMADLCDLSRHLGFEPGSDESDADDDLCPVF